MVMPIVFSLSIFVKTPVYAAEDGSDDSINEQNINEINKLSESQRYELDATIDQANLAAEELVSPPVLIVELSDSNELVEESFIDPSAVDQQSTVDSWTVDSWDEWSQSAKPDRSPEQPASGRPALNPFVPHDTHIDSEAMEQVPSASQLSDVQPVDWAYQALQSLVERYGCIVGYPDGTFQGQSALTRYEFAAGLNACLDRINEMVTASTADLATQEDLAILRRLQDEFAVELAILRGRVDGLEARVSELEANQFSTTTILHGSAIFAAAGVFGESADDNQIVGRYRLNLSTITSFTGRDALLLSMFAGNAPLGEADRENLTARSASFDLPGVEVNGTFNGIPVTVGQSTSEGTLSSEFGANTNNELKLFTAGYSFPVGDRLNVAALTSLAPFQIYAPTLNPYLDDMDGGTGAISVFGEYNPIYALSGGGTGVILNYQIFDSLKLTGGYLADGLLVGDPSNGSGLFNGGYAALGQLTWNVTDNFAIAAVYTNEYAPSGRFGFNYNGLGVTGTAVANSLAGQDILGADQLGFDASPVITNGYGLNVNWQPSPRFSISGWFSTFYPRLIGEGDGNILTYALTFAFPDLGQKGNLLGLVVGAEPYLTRMGGNPQDFDVDVPLHIEAFYRHRIGDHIFLTPGIIWLAAPNQDRGNGSDFIATLRTTFTF